MKLTQDYFYVPLIQIPKIIHVTSHIFISAAFMALPDENSPSAYIVILLVFEPYTFRIQTSSVAALMICSAVINEILT
jgi:hypothetical protein